MNNTLLLIISISSLIIAGVLILLHYKKTTVRNRKLIKLSNELYNFLATKRIGASLESIKIRIYNNTFGEDWLIKYKTIMYWIWSWIVGIVSVIFVVIYFRNNIYITITLILFCFEIKSLVLDLLIGDDTNFLIGIYNYSIELQQAYSMEKDVSNAIHEANNNSTNFNLIKRMEEIEKILNDQEAIDEYIQDCPNEFLKLITINCNLVNENGDKKDVDGKSVFLENLFYTNALIEAEVFKRRRLQFWLKGLAPLSIIPLLAFSPYELWVNGLLPITDIFYKTKFGFITKLMITILAISIFYIIKSFEKASNKRNLNEKTKFWEERFFKIPLIKTIVIALSPKPNSPKGYKYKKIINESGEYTKVEYIYLRKLLFAMIGFIVTISIAISINNITKNNIINNQTSKYGKSLIVSNGGQVDSTTIEKELLQEVDLSDIEGSYIKIKEKIESYGIINDSDFLAKKVIEKEIDVANQTIKIYDILIALVIAIIGYNVPEFSLKLKTKLRKYEMQNEVIIFETIILIYMYHENATPELILENMSKFADIFKLQIDAVLKEIKKSDEESLQVIVDEIKYKPFLNLIKNIIKAENIKTKNAFISLADNRRNYIANRKEDNKEVIYKSVSKSRMLSLIPATLVITLYITLPMIYIAFVQLDTTQTQLNNMQTEQDNSSFIQEDNR